MVDEDEGTNSVISFSLANNTGNAFLINSPKASGETSHLKLVKRLDFETLSMYHLSIIAHDGGDPQNNASVQVDIEVTDVIDSPPQFDRPLYVIDVPENTSVGDELLTLQATTLDSPSIATIQYFFRSGNTESKFTLDSNLGTLTLIDDLDYEQTTFYELSVQAQTGPSSSLQTLVSIKVNVININDHAPIFSRSMYITHIHEGIDSQPHKTVLSVEATDSDKGRYGKIVYCFEGNRSNISNYFSLNGTTGTITILKALDHETQPVYSFYVIARDKGDPPRSDTVPVTIEVTNINDEYPVFVALEYNVTISENINGGASVAQLEAHDADSSSVEYYIETDGARSHFTIERTSGLLSTKNSLDREENDFYVIEVSASDGQFVSKLNAFVYVNVTDKNDRSPLFLKNIYLVELSELKPVNTTVTRVEARDEDEGTNKDISYFSLNIPDTFHIDAQSGYIEMVESLDYEAKQYFSFQVWARDHGDSPLSSSAIVQVSILDENDNTPMFEPGLRVGHIQENSPAHTSVLQLMGEDQDSGSNGEVSFEITGNNPAVHAFTINMYGMIRTRRPLDREQRAMYSLNVRLSDKGEIPLSTTTRVEISVNDVIDYPPVFSLVGYEAVITEETPANTVLVTVSAQTLDLASPASILYTISSGGNSSLFRINQISGAISTASLMRPTLHKGTYHLRINAQHAHLSTTAPVTIRVVLDSGIPRLKPLTIYFNIFLSLLQPLTTLGAVAVDGSHEGPHTFSLDTADPGMQNSFSIQPDTGALAVSSAVQSGHYQLTVITASPTGVGSDVVHVYVHTISNATLESTVIVEFNHITENEFASTMVENFAAILTEIIPCTRDQVEILGIQEGNSAFLQVAFAIRETDCRSYLPVGAILDRLRANMGSSRLLNVVRFGSEVCTAEPCPSFQLCSPVVDMYRYSPGVPFKVLQSTERVHISHSFANSFVCHCPPGYDSCGFCSGRTDACESSPCQFGGVCYSLNGDFSCECPPFTGGKNCSIVCPSSSCAPCSPDRCLHGSRCKVSRDFISYTCDSCPWPEKYRGPNCELTSVHVSADGFLALPSLSSAVETQISFSFSTVSSDGLLLYTGRVSGSHDLLAIELVSGQLRVTVDLWKEPATLITSSRRKLSDGKWHNVSLQLDGNLQVNMIVRISNSVCVVIGIKWVSVGCGGVWFIWYVAIHWQV